MNRTPKTLEACVGACACDRTPLLKGPDINIARLKKINKHFIKRWKYIIRLLR